MLKRVLRLNGEIKDKKGWVLRRFALYRAVQSKEYNKNHLKIRPVSNPRYLNSQIELLPPSIIQIWQFYPMISHYSCFINHFILCINIIT